jgi:hypothetical protein
MKRRSCHRVPAGLALSVIAYNPDAAAVRGDLAAADVPASCATCTPTGAANAWRRLPWPLDFCGPRAGCGFAMSGTFGPIR